MAVVGARLAFGLGSPLADGPTCTHTSLAFERALLITISAGKLSEASDVKLTPLA